MTPHRIVGPDSTALLIALEARRARHVSRCDFLAVENGLRCVPDDGYFHRGSAYSGDVSAVCMIRFAHNILGGSDTCLPVVLCVHIYSCCCRQLVLGSGNHR